MQNSQLDRIWILHPKGIYFSFIKIIASKKHQIVHESTLCYATSFCYYRMQEYGWFITMTQ
jgi:hypothetical protein